MSSSSIINRIGFLCIFLFAFFHDIKRYLSKDFGLMNGHFHNIIFVNESFAYEKSPLGILTLKKYP